MRKIPLVAQQILYKQLFGSWQTYVLKNVHSSNELTHNLPLGPSATIYKKQYCIYEHCSSTP